MADLSENFLKLLEGVTAKRARIVIDHILKNGYVTNEDLKDLYNYQHPPRAIGDVRDHGIPLERFSITTPDGRKITAYRFADQEQTRTDILSGRRSFSKEFKKRMLGSV